MSLIKCPECDHQVSSKAPHCPHCGVPILGNVKRCPACEGFVLMEDASCPHCGARFAMPPTPPADTPTPPAPPVELPIEEKVTTDDSPVTPPRSKSNAPWYLLLLAILVIAIGGAIYWMHLNREASEEQAFIQLQDCQDPLNYEDFIVRYPDSEHITLVRERLEELRSIDREWERISISLNVEELQQFVDQYPASVHRMMALHKIDSLDWREADRRGTAAAYALYIGRHESGEYIELALNARREAERREAQQRLDSIEAAQLAHADSIALAAGGVPSAQ